MGNLKKLQHWFYDTVTKPGLIQESDEITTLIRPSSKLAPKDRIAIYRNAYFLRLIGVFEAEYPVLKYLLGEELFNNFVLLFLREFPPESYTLHQLSERFVEFLEQSQPEEHRKELWPLLLIEIATLERIFQKVYLEKGIESHTDFNSDNQIEQTLSEEWIALTKLGYVRFMKCTFPVHVFLQQVRQDFPAEIPDPKDTYLIIYRKNYKVVMHETTSQVYAELASYYEE